MDMSKKSVGVCLFFIMTVLFAFVSPTFATKFDLIPPSGTLQRGQNITFTINIDTEGTSVTSIQSGLTYDSTLLQYVSVTAGAAMNSVVADTTTYGTGKILLTGTNNTGYNGTGVFATVVFTIIAQSSGSTEICTLWLPTVTPTPPPQLVCGSPCSTSGSQCPSNMSCYSGYCRNPVCPQATNCVCPAPTALPVTGNTDPRNTAVVLAASFFVAAGGIFYLSQKQKYALPNKSIKKQQATTKPPIQAHVHKK